MAANNSMGHYPPCKAGWDALYSLQMATGSAAHTLWIPFTHGDDYSMHWGASWWDLPQLGNKGPSSNPEWVAQYDKKTQLRLPVAQKKMREG